MNLEDLPLRHPRDIYCQEVSRKIRGAIGNIPYNFKDLWLAFLRSPAPQTELSTRIYETFESLATAAGLTTGERTMIMGAIIFSLGRDLVQEECKK